MKLIYIYGIDGSGKTTLSHNVVKKLNAMGICSRYFYARHFPVLLYPLKFFAKNSVFKNQNEFNDYSSYKKKKSSFVNDHPFIGKVYGYIWIFDYLIATYFRMLPLLLKNGVVIVDRFYLDLAVNISETLNLDSESMNALSIKLSRFFPKPKTLFYIDIPPEIACKRKNDIQSIQYLTERFTRYFYLNKILKPKFLDGTLPQEKLADNAVELIATETYE